MFFQNFLLRLLHISLGPNSTNSQNSDSDGVYEVSFHCTYMSLSLFNNDFTSFDSEILFSFALQVPCKSENYRQAQPSCHSEVAPRSERENEQHYQVKEMLVLLFSSDIPFCYLMWQVVQLAPKGDTSFHLLTKVKPCWARLLMEWVTNQEKPHAVIFGKSGWPR